MRPSFIVGAGRSGTTLVVNLLGLHSQVEPIFETGFVVTLLQVLRDLDEGGVERFRDELDRIRVSAERFGRDLTENDLSRTLMPELPYGKIHVTFTDKEVREATEALLRDLDVAKTREQADGASRRYVNGLFELQASRAGKPDWVNKTPAYVEYLPELAGVFPDARFIHVVRDGRDVVCSLLDQNWGISGLEEAAGRWKTQVQAGLDYASAHPDRVLEVRYEELLRSPGSELARICAEFGLEDESERILTQLEERGYSIVEPRSKWRVQLTSEERDQLESSIGDTLRQAGYTDPTAAERDQAASIGEDELAALRFKAARYTEMLAEYQQARESAARYDELAPELSELRFKAGREADLVRENDKLKVKERKYDRLSAELEAFEIAADPPYRTRKRLENLTHAAEEYRQNRVKIAHLKGASEKAERLQDEIAETREQVQKLTRFLKLLESLDLPSDPRELRPVIVSLRRAAEGAEDAAQYKRLVKLLESLELPSDLGELRRELVSQKRAAERGEELAPLSNEYKGLLAFLERIGLDTSDTMQLRRELNLMSRNAEGAKSPSRRDSRRS